MADNQSELIKRLEDLAAEVDAYTTDRSQELAEAVAEAKAAWEADSDAEHEAALAKIDEISAKLKEFSPSGN